MLYISIMKTPDGYTLIYISDYFFNVLEKELNSIARTPMNLVENDRPMVALRDEPARVEFRRLTEAQEMGRFLGRSGGKATLKKYGREHYVKMGRKK